MTSTWRTSGHLVRASSTAGLSPDAGAPAVAAVGGDHHLDPAVLDPRGQGVGGEAAEHDRVRGADPGAGQHRHRGLGDHRQVDRHPVPGLHPELDQRVGGLLHLGGQLRVRDLAGVAGLALEVEGHPIAVAGLDVPVAGVVGRVQGAVGEPLREGRVAPVQHLGRLDLPAEPLGLLGPEAVRVGRRLLVRRRRHVGRRGQVLRRREPPVLVRQVGQGVLGRLASSLTAEPPRRRCTGRARPHRPWACVIEVRRASGEPMRPRAARGLHGRPHRPRARPPRRRSPPRSRPLPVPPPARCRSGPPPYGSSGSASTRRTPRRTRAPLGRCRRRLTPVPDQTTRAATSTLSSLPGATTTGTPWARANWTPPYPPLVTNTSVRANSSV